NRSSGAYEFNGQSTPGPTNTPTQTLTNTPSPTHTAIQTPTATSMVTATATPSPSPSATATRSPTRSATLTPTHTVTLTSTNTPTRTPTPTPANTATRTPTGTASPGFVVDGQIRYYSNGLPMAGVQVHVDGATSTVVSTDATGTYAASELSQTNWIFEPQMHGDADAGISALDAAFILQFLVGLRQLSSEQQLACDVSANGMLHALDPAFILHAMWRLSPGLQFPQNCGSDWAVRPVRATESNQVLIQPQLAVGSCQRGAIEFQPLPGDASGQDFSAMLFGDCTGNWQPPA